MPCANEKFIKPEILPHGLDGLTLRLGLTLDEETLAAVQELRAALETKPPEGVEEIVGSLVSVYVSFDRTRTDRAAVAHWVRDITARTQLTGKALPRPTRRWTIPVTLGGEDGPQFAELAKQGDLTETKARKIILETPVRVLTIGFAPGLPYMGLLPKTWDIPRLSQITPNVPRGALVAALRQLIIFTNPTPTGWRHIGKTAFKGFDPARNPATFLKSGDEIRFSPATPAEMRALENDNSDGRGGARLEALT